MKLNKKAAMELGISTVVMLVIAIVIIGGGIAFIRGFFGQGTDTLTGAFEVADFGLEPTPQRPLVLIDGQVAIKTGRREVVRIGFYNKQDGLRNVSIGFGNCVTTENTESACEDYPVKPMITVLPQDVDVGEQAGFGTQVQAKCAGTGNNLPAGTYTCNLVAYNCEASLDDCSDYSNQEVLERTQIIFNVRP